ncbi:er-golgi snare complex subunit [Stemphylium lycopersici]|uniref:Er-golgi snare complex subunit n=1 Tax=Stemphylium lycopersici TaxID=183478 RepID=A0A364MZW5_STELY|nr:er-golgi snare complex subunit [Stemphylium lycopersici]RAR01414.1 er-golgi snare complex subunit [Stemphylium lycopersici]RAR07847.1 er-golgi snare complex subunit [Stemphylium lycopersici]
MSNRFTRADPRDDLFSSYNRSASPSKSKNKARASPYNAGGVGGAGYGYGYTPPPAGADGGFGAYPGANGSGSGGLFPGGSSSSSGGGGSGRGGGGYGVVGGGSGYRDDFRSATPNSRGQYSAAVLDELESQNDEHVGVLTGKVRMLKDLTHLIGDEIRESSSLADKMNDQFENSRHKIKGTMNHRKENGKSEE